MTRNCAIYVYCLVRAARRPPVARLPKPLPQAAALALTPADGRLMVVTSDVPLDVYGPSELEPRLRDLDWVSEVAIAHERVVQHFARRSALTVVPMKMFTMFSSIDRALADVRGRRAEIDRALARVAGCEEWGIRVTRMPGQSPAASATRRPAAKRSTPSSGMAFLAARRDAHDAAASAKSAARTTADRAYTRLAQLARAARRRDGCPEPGRNPPVLEAAFLVTSGARTRFKAEARRQAASCEASGASLVLTGPWAAYNFVNMAEERR